MCLSLCACASTLCLDTALRFEVRAAAQRGVEVMCQHRNCCRCVQCCVCCMCWRMTTGLDSLLQHLVAHGRLHQLWCTSDSTDSHRVFGTQISGPPRSDFVGLGSLLPLRGLARPESGSKAL